MQERLVNLRDKEIKVTVIYMNVIGKMRAFCFEIEYESILCEERESDVPEIKIK